MRSIEPVIALLAITAVCGVVAADYDPAVALRGLFYTKVSKCPPQAIQAWSCASCSNFTAGTVSNVTVIYTDPDQIQMIVAYNSEFNEIAIAFRGSTTAKNWIEDAEVLLMPYPNCDGCKVHTGFYTTYMQIESNITDAVSELLIAYPNASIFVTGHSLGAAQSRLCALHMQRRFGSTNRVFAYSAGAPRLGNPAFAQYAANALARHEHYYLVHAADPVPHLPPTSWGYLHFPQEVWYKKGITPAGYKVCNGTAVAEDPTCSDSLKAPIDVSDHFEYLGITTGCGGEKDPMEAVLTTIVSQRVHL